MLVVPAGTTLEAKQPGTNNFRPATVLEEAVKDQHAEVKVRFHSSTDAVLLPWRHLKTKRLEKKSNPVITQSNPVSVSLDAIAPAGDCPPPAYTSPVDVVDLTLDDKVGKSKNADGVGLNNNAKDECVEIIEPVEKASSVEPVESLSWKKWLTSKKQAPSVPSKPTSRTERHSDAAHSSTLFNSRGSADQSLLKTSSIPPRGSEEQAPRAPVRRNLERSKQVSNTGSAAAQRHEPNSFALSRRTLLTPPAKRPRLQPPRNEFQPFIEETPTDVVPFDDEDRIEPNLDKPQVNSMAGRLESRRVRFSDVPIPRIRPQTSDNCFYPKPYERGRSSNWNIGSRNDGQRRTRQLSNGEDRKSSPQKQVSQTEGWRTEIGNSGSSRRRRRHRFSSAPHMVTKRPGAPDQSRAIPLTAWKDIRISQAYDASDKFPFRDQAVENQSKADEAFRVACEAVAAVDVDELTVGSAGEENPRLASEPRNRCSRRRKGKPVRWFHSEIPLRRPSRDGVSKRPESNLVTKDPVIVHIPDVVLAGGIVGSNSSAPRIFSCMCGIPRENLHPYHDKSSSIQCGICGLWSHLECTQLREDEWNAVRDEHRIPRKRFMCIRCMESTIKSCHQPIQPDGIEDSWICQIRPLLLQMQNLRITNTSDDVLAPRPRARDQIASADRTQSSRCDMRQPLQLEEVLARKENVEVLRSGVFVPSVGDREQALIDVRVLERLRGKR